LHIDNYDNVVYLSSQQFPCSRHSKKAKLGNQGWLCEQAAWRGGRYTGTECADCEELCVPLDVVIEIFDILNAQQSQ
jgi:hypothetical protein